MVLPDKYENLGSSELGCRYEHHMTGSSHMNILKQRRKVSTIQSGAIWTLVLTPLICPVDDTQVLWSQSLIFMCGGEMHWHLWLIFTGETKNNLQCVCAGDTHKHTTVVLHVNPSSYALVSFSSMVLCLKNALKLLFCKARKCVFTNYDLQQSCCCTVIRSWIILIYTFIVINSPFYVCEGWMNMEILRWHFGQLCWYWC